MVWPNALARHFQAQVIQARERAQVGAIKDSIGHVEVFRMDGVGTPIIGRPRPLPGHDTPNPANNTYTLNYEEPVWGLEMFCDSPRLDYFRAIRPTKNMTALTIPSFAFVILVVAAAKTLEKYCGKLPHAVSAGVLALCAIGMFVFLISLFPINLPRAMYPEYQAERRRLKRLQREYEHDPMFMRRGPSLAQTRECHCTAQPSDGEKTWRE